MSHPLQGVRILELGQIIAGTYGGQVLSDLGAEVIKIESPTGDLGRNSAVAPYRGVSGLFLTFNRNKKSVVINLKTDAGRRIFYNLVKLADVVIDNFRPGVLKQLQIDYETLSQINPRIIQCSVTGFGMTGSYKDYPALDLSIQAIAGHMAVTGEPGRPPSRVGIPLGDLSGGIFASQSVLTALFDRERTGRGRQIDISLFDVMLHMLTYMGTMWLTNAELPEPSGSAHNYTVPWQAFAASDGYVVVAAREPSTWVRLCEVLGEPELAYDPRFATAEDRVRNRAILVPHLEAIFGTRPVVEWVERLRAADLSAAPVNHFDRAFAEAPVAEREMIVEYDHPDVGKVRLPGNPIKMSGMTGTISNPAPRLGEHTDAVLSQLLSLSPDEIASLRQQGAIG